MKNFISKYCIIKPNEVFVNGKLEFSNIEQNGFGAFMKSIYKHNEIKYPKYFKMDNLCKVAFIASEIILKGNDHIKKLDPTKVGIIIQNSHSSIDTDIKYNETIKDKSNYFPSPAVFVYTLPNVMIGEICIRNKFQGENTCFIAKEFNPEFVCDYVSNLLDSNKLDACITGWADYVDEEYSAKLFLVEKNEENKKDNISFKPEIINQLSR
ncbi:MAG: hypothetical protein PF485_04300 [Bacteroidales bacterium]|jgi:hypothetical protein|nr:hypothetical protein [Bacteroidales bacterium]